MKKFILFLAFFLPFQFALNPAPGIDLAIARLLIAIAFFVWLISGLSKKRLKIPNNYTTWGLLLFLLFAFLSIIKAEEISWAIRKLLVFVSIVPLYFVVSDTLRKKDFLKLSRIFVYSSFTISILGIFQFISQFIWNRDLVFDFWSKYLAGFFLGSAFSEAVIALPSWWVNVSGRTILRTTSLFPDPHMLAFFLGMTLPFAIALLSIKKRPRKYYVFYGLIAATNLICLVLTFSRGGYFGLAASGLWFIANSLLRSNKKQKIILTGILMFLVILIFSIAPVRSRLLSSFDLSEGSVAGRIEIWQQALSVWRGNFFLGVGIGNYSYYLNPLFDYRLPVYAHNAYLDIGVEMGIFALLAWISIFAYTIYKLFKIHILPSRTFNSRFKIQGMILSASLVYFLAHSFFDTPIYSPRILPLLIIVLAVSSVVIKKD